MVALSANKIPHLYFGNSKDGQKVKWHDPRAQRARAGDDVCGQRAGEDEEDELKE